MKGGWGCLLLLGAVLLYGSGCIREVPPSNSKTIRLVVPNLMTG